MDVCFSCVAFVKKGTLLGVVGGDSSLGQWNVLKSVPLVPMTQISADGLEPSLWSRTVRLAHKFEDHLEYKYIMWEGDVDQNYLNSSLSPPLSPSIDSNGARTVSFHFPTKFDFELSPPDACQKVRWEGRGAHDNRAIFWETSKCAASVCVHSAVLSKEDETNGVYFLRPVHFLENDLEDSEGVWTHRYYDNVRHKNEMHFNKIFEGLYVGTCPRKFEHLAELERLGITAVMNFQTQSDVEHNWRENDRDLHRIYENRQIRFIWSPTADMCAESRAQMAPQAALILAGLLANEHKVYVHCNAGVGRASACVCAYLKYYIGLTVRQVHLAICLTRPVAYFDEPSLLKGQKAYKDLFGTLRLK